MTDDHAYRKSTCCGGRDCDLLGLDPAGPCWGPVEMAAGDDDEDGCPVAYHRCRGHFWYGNWELPDAERAYRPRPGKDEP